MLLAYFALIIVMVHSATLIVTVFQILVLMGVVLLVTLHQHLNALDQYVNKIVIVLLIPAKTTFAPFVAALLDLTVMGQHALLILIAY
jgi:hypothetical protein